MANPTNASSQAPARNNPETVANAIQISSVAARLQTYQRQQYQPGPETRQAAVSIILRNVGTGAHAELPKLTEHTEVLFIKRADKPGDPWSGHMAFPGGHLEASDGDLAAAAARETLEEIGLDLDANASYLGALDQQRANPKGRELDMIIEPHVYELHQLPPLNLNYEVADVVWANLGTLMLNSLHDTEVKPMMGTPTTFNGYRLSPEHFVWGLTYRMLKAFFDVALPNWQPPQEID